MNLNNRSRHWKASLSICVALTALFLRGSASAEMRVWEDKAGNAVRGEFVRELFGSIELRQPDGSLHSIPVENLSAQDTDYLRTRIPPEIELEVRTQKRPKERNKNASRARFEQFRDDIDVVTARVSVRKKSSAAFTGTLRAEVYLIGKEVATDDYRLSGKSTENIRFTEENRGVYTFETSADFRVYEEYNKLEIRGAEYTGYLVIILDSMGKRLAFKTDLSWLTDDKIDAIRTFHVDSFFDKNGRKLSVPRPMYYDGRFEF